MVPNLKVLQNDDFETKFNQTNDSVLNTIKKLQSSKHNDYKKQN